MSNGSAPPSKARDESIVGTRLVEAPSADRAPTKRGGAVGGHRRGPSARQRACAGDGHRPVREQVATRIVVGGAQCQRAPRQRGTAPSRRNISHRTVWRESSTITLPRGPLERRGGVSRRRSVGAGYSTDAASTDAPGAPASAMAPRQEPIPDSYIRRCVTKDGKTRWSRGTTTRRRGAPWRWARSRRSPRRRRRTGRARTGEPRGMPPVPPPRPGRGAPTPPSAARALNPPRHPPRLRARRKKGEKRKNRRRGAAPLAAPPPPLVRGDGRDDRDRRSVARARRANPARLRAHSATSPRPPSSPRKPRCKSGCPRRNEAWRARGRRENASDVAAASPASVSAGRTPRLASPRRRRGGLILAPSFRPPERRRRRRASERRPSPTRPPRGESSSSSSHGTRRRAPRRSLLGGIARRLSDGLLGVLSRAGRPAGEVSGATLVPAVGPGWRWSTAAAGGGEDGASSSRGSHRRVRGRRGRR